MVDLTRPIRIFLNGKEILNGKMTYNRTFMLNNFREDADRKAIWVNYLRLTL
jgi:hypothetical protein